MHSSMRFFFLHQRVARRARLCILACGVGEVETLIRHFENMIEVTFEKLPHVDVLGGKMCEVGVQ